MRIHYVKSNLHPKEIKATDSTDENTENMRLT